MSIKDEAFNNNNNTNNNNHIYNKEISLQFELKLQKCIRMRITVFKIFIWGGISSDICSEITFYGSARALP